MRNQTFSLCDSLCCLCASLCYKIHFKPVTQSATEKTQRTTENKFSDVPKGL